MDHSARIILVATCCLLLGLVVGVPILLCQSEDTESTNPELDRFEELQGISFRHIFIGTYDVEGEEEIAKRRARAEEAREKAVAGEDFAELAREYSELPEEPSARGEVVSAPLGKLNAELEQALMKLRPGEITPVLSTKYGFEVLQLHGFSGTYKLPPPQPTPTPVFQQRMAVYSVTAHDFERETSSGHYKIGSRGIWSADSPAVFYAPVHVPDECEITGFNFWVNDEGTDAGGDRRPEGGLLEVTLRTGKVRVIGRTDSDRFQQPLSMVHYPGAKYHVNNDAYGLVLCATTYLGDARQSIAGGVVVFMINAPEGVEMTEYDFGYVRRSQEHAGVCPMRAMREKLEREARGESAAEEEPGSESCEGSHSKSGGSESKNPGSGSK
jgi:hypothetical protein